MEKISWTDRVRNVCYIVKEEKNIVQTTKRRKANWIGHILRRNCLTKHVIEGKIEGRVGVTGRQGGRRKQILRNPYGNKKILEIEGGSTRWHRVEMSMC
jgi:hypothetical protein